jgi:mono/diheme cytochrome c family protein
MTSLPPTAALIATVTFLAAGVVHADGSGDPAAVRSQDGEYFDKAGNPTFHIAKDGTVDWYTYSGYVRYGANCLQCHGPDGLGSSYAPSLVDSLMSLSYPDFLSIVASGKQDVNAAQPGHAVFRHEPKRHVLHRPDPRLPASAVRRGARS